MTPIDPIIQWAAEHLGGRSVPDDLRKLLAQQWRDAAGGRGNRLNRAGITLIEDDRMPRLIAAVCAGREEGTMRLAHAQAMADMIRLSGFVAEDASGDAIGYWFSPEHISIETAPALRFDTDGKFSILPGYSLAEAMLVVASRGNDQTFSELRDYLGELGLNIAARTIQDVQQRDCAVLPQAVYEQLVRAYSADLSTTSAPDVGNPVQIMTINRGPKIGPEPD